MKKRLASLPVLAAVALVNALPLARAAELNGVELPDTQIVDGKTLVLNGIGMREATIFHVKVYAGGLYLEAPTSDTDAIVKSAGLKRVVMRFTRDVDAKKIQEAWQENFEKNCGTQCTALKPRNDELVAFLKDDVKKNDGMTFTFYPDRTEVVLSNGQKKLVVAQGEFAKVTLMSWIGPYAANAGLREGMLGKHPKTK